MSKLLSFLLAGLAHWPEIAAACGVLCSAVAAFGRAIPPARWRALEASHPRVAHAFRFCRAAGFDVVKAARAAWAILGPVVRPLVLALLARRGLRLPGDRDALPPPHPRAPRDQP